MKPYRVTAAQVRANFCIAPHRSEPRILHAAALASLVTLGACGVSPALNTGRYFEDDGPGRHAPDIANIPDAIPKAEPLSKSGNKPYQVFGVTYTPRADVNG